MVMQLALATVVFRCVQAYAPNHPLHPLHPILTSATATTKTHPLSSSPPKPQLQNDPYMSQQPPTNDATATAPTTQPSSTILATPTVDQLELHQLLQRQRHSTTTTTTVPHMKTMEDEDLDSSTMTMTTSIKKKKMPRKRSAKPAGHHVALLTAAEEMEYSYRIRTLRAALRIREQLVTLQNGIYIHPTEQQWCRACGCTTLKQLRRLVQEGQAAKTLLISANTGLVVQYAKKQYATLKHAMEAGGGVGTILTLPDMIQEGHFGLMEAAERYQPDKGFRFSTYATYWVKQRILRCISDSSRTIRLPVHVHETLYKIKKAKRTLYSSLGREATVAEIAQYLDISEDRIRSYTASSRNVMSLERPLTGTVSGSGTSNAKSSLTASSSGGGGGVISSGGISGTSGSGGNGGKSGGGGGASSLTEDTRTLLDTIASDGPTPEEDAVLNSMRRDIRAVLDAELAGLEQQVVRYRFGLVYDDDDDDSSNDDAVRQRRIHRFNNTMNKCGESYSVRETSQILQISMDRVRLLEARALNKLRHPMRNYKLKDYVQGLGSTTTTSSSSGNDGMTKPASSIGIATSRSRLRPKATTARTSSSSSSVKPLSPLQQWLSFQQSDYYDDDDDTNNNNNNAVVERKNRLEEAYANSPSSYTTASATSGEETTTTSADRYWFF